MARLSDDKVRTGRSYQLQTDLVLNALADDDRETLDRWLRDPVRFPARAISRALYGEGIELSPNAILTWRDRNGVS